MRHKEFFARTGAGDVTVITFARQTFAQIRAQRNGQLVAIGVSQNSRRGRYGGENGFIHAEHQREFKIRITVSLATIGLTIPAVAVAAYALHKTLVLGLDTQEMVLLVLTFILSMLTFGTGRTNILFGLVHVVVFAVFLFLVFVP